MDFKPVQPDLVRFEMRLVAGDDPRIKEQGRPGGFGRFLSGAGRVLGAMAMPLSLLFPPAAIAAAGMYGVGQIGDQVQARAYTKAMENYQRQRMQTVSFPGLNAGRQAPTPAASSVPGDQAVMDVLFKRDEAAMQMLHGM